MHVSILLSYIPFLRRDAALCRRRAISSHLLTSRFRPGWSKPTSQSSSAVCLPAPSSWRPCRVARPPSSSRCGRGSWAAPSVEAEAALLLAQARERCLAARPASTSARRPRTATAASATTRGACTSMRCTIRGRSGRRRRPPSQATGWGGILPPRPTASTAVRIRWYEQRAAGGL